MMRAMREITKPVFWVVAISFIGWLAYGQVTDFIAGGRDVVLKVDGEIVRSQPFQLQYQAALEQYRRQQGGARLSREEEQQVQNQVADQFIQKILLDHAFRRLGITVSDDEIIEAARSSPPPQIVQQVIRDATFQTNGQFDISKWQRYLASAGPEFTSQIEALYRDYLPQQKLQEYLTADTATALAQVRGLRAEITAGKAKFEEVAKKESADSASGAQGGDLGWVKRAGSGFDRQFAAAMVRLKPGELSQPVLTQFGYHLIRVDAAQGDSLHVRHILVPIALQGKHLDMVDARTDTLDRLAAEQTDGTKLDAAARALGLPLARAPKLVQGDRLTLGKYVVPDVGVWAFEATPGETSPVIEGERASYVFRLDSIFPEGVPPLAQIRDRVTEGARYEKKKAVARERAEQMAAALRDATDLLAAGRARGFPVQKLGPFTRLTAPADFARNPLVLGAGFGLRPGERTGLLAGETGLFLLQGITRTRADSVAWLKQRDRQRDTLLRPLMQARIQQYLAALRAQTKIVDRRKELYRPTASSGG